MEGFTYYNMFDTKGIEYLIIIAFLILLIPFALILNRRVNLKHQVHKAMGFLSSAFLRIPQGILFSRNHTWTHLSKNGEASVGLDDLLLHLTGEVSLRYLKNPGDQINRGEAMVELIGDGKRLTVFSPISGEITGLNSAIQEDSWQMNEDPYDQGWIYQIKPSNWKEETGSLLIADKATMWTHRELDRFKDFLSSAWPRHDLDASPVMMQEGGELQDHVMAGLPEGLWRDFQTEFLNPASS